MFVELILNKIGIKLIGDVLLAHHINMNLAGNYINVLHAQ
jgi:hypothetical protein